GLSSTLSSALAPHRRAGTLAYAAPEVFRGQLSIWTDQFALAVTYCELRGKRPFKSVPSQFTPDFVHPEPDLSVLTEAERPIIARALSPSPPERWKSCGEFMGHLSQRVG